MVDDRLLSYKFAWPRNNRPTLVQSKAQLFLQSFFEWIFEIQTFVDMFLFSFLCGLLLSTACNASITFEQGVFSVETISIPDLTTDSATTLTLTGTFTTQTRVVPVWHCTSGCENNNYGIIVRPPIATATGFPGNVFPPAGYLVTHAFTLMRS